MAALEGYRGEDHRLLPVQREVGIALRKWALGIISVGLFQLAAFVWGAATLHTTVAIHDTVIKQSMVERKSLNDRLLIQEQRVEGLENSMTRLGIALESMTRSIGTMSVDVAVLRREQERSLN